MKACLPVRAFAWKEVSTETLPDSCPDPLLFLLFSRRFPAPSLLLGLLRFHQIEQLLFRVDLKLGIEMPRMRRPGQHVLHVSLRQPGLFRRPYPWLRRVRGQRHQRVSGPNPETSLSAIPSFNPSHTRKDQPSGWPFLHCMQMGLARLALPQIASATHGFDVLGNLGAELSAQAAHMHIDRAAAAVIVEAPHL